LFSSISARYAPSCPVMPVIKAVFITSNRTCKTIEIKVIARYYFGRIPKPDIFAVILNFAAKPC
jgi:hypothetical protein